jgi:hypothetical protein
MKRIMLRFSDEEYQKVKDYALGKELSINDVLRMAIREWQPKS